MNEHEAALQPIKSYLPWADLQGLSPEQSAFQRTHPAVRTRVLNWLHSNGQHQALAPLVGIHRAQSQVDGIRARQGRPSPYRPAHMAQPYLNPMDETMRMRAVAAAIPDETGLKAAGVAVIAMDTGRVLMQQRALNPMMCPCGMGVTWDEMNGYQHDDGSVSHDNSDMSVSEMLDQGHPDVGGCSCCQGAGDDEQGSECVACDGSGMDQDSPSCDPPCRDSDFSSDGKVSEFPQEKTGYSLVDSLQYTAALEYDPHEGTWEFPGGKLDPGESPRDAAVREFREEVGQDLPPGVFVGSWLSPGGKVSTFSQEKTGYLEVTSAVYDGDPPVQHQRNLAGLGWKKADPDGYSWHLDDPQTGTNHSADWSGNNWYLTSSAPEGWGLPKEWHQFSPQAAKDTEDAHRYRESEHETPEAVHTQAKINSASYGGLGERAVKSLDPKSHPLVGEFNRFLDYTPDESHDPMRRLNSVPKEADYQSNPSPGDLDWLTTQGSQHGWRPDASGLGGDSNFWARSMPNGTQHFMIWSPMAGKWGGDVVDSDGRSMLGGRSPAFDSARAAHHGLNITQDAGQVERQRGQLRDTRTPESNQGYDPKSTVEHVTTPFGIKHDLFQRLNAAPAEAPEPPQGFKDLEGLGWDVEYRPRLGEHRANLTDEYGTEHHAYYDPYWRGWTVRSENSNGRRSQQWEKTPQAVDLRSRAAGKGLGVDPELGEKAVGFGFQNMKTTDWPVETRSLFDRLSAVHSPFGDQSDFSAMGWEPVHDGQTNEYEKHDSGFRHNAQYVDDPESPTGFSWRLNTFAAGNLVGGEKEGDWGDSNHFSPSDVETKTRQRKQQWFEDAVKDGGFIAPGSRPRPTMIPSDVDRRVQGYKPEQRIKDSAPYDITVADWSNPHHPFQRLNGTKTARGLEYPDAHHQPLVDTGWTPRPADKSHVHPEFTLHHPGTGVHYQLNWDQDGSGQWLGYAHVPDENSQSGWRDINAEDPKREQTINKPYLLSSPEEANKWVKSTNRAYVIGSQHGEDGLARRFEGDPEMQWMRSEPAFERQREGDPMRGTHPQPDVSYQDFKVPKPGEPWIEGYHSRGLLDEPAHSNPLGGIEKLNRTASDWKKFDTNGAYRFGHRDGARGDQQEADRLNAKMDMKLPLDEYETDYLEGHIHGTERARENAEGNHAIRQLFEQAPEYGSLEHEINIIGKGVEKESASKAPVYKGFIYLIQRESDIDLGNRAIANPDDPDGDMSEQSAWWDIEHAKKNPALRKEVKSGTPWDELELWADKSVRSNREVTAMVAKLAKSGSVSDEFGWMADQDDYDDEEEGDPQYEQDELFPHRQPNHYYNEKSGRPDSPDTQANFDAQKSKAEADVAGFKQMYQGGNPDAAPSDMMRDKQLRLLGPEWNYVRGKGGHARSAYKNVDGISHHVTMVDPIWRGGPNNHEAVYHHLLVHPTGEVAKRYVGDIGRVFDVAEGKHPSTDDVDQWPTNGGGGWVGPRTRAPFQTVDQGSEGWSREQRAQRRAELEDNAQFDPEKHTSFPDAEPGEDKRRSPQFTVLHDSIYHPNGSGPRSFQAGSISGQAKWNDADQRASDFTWSHYRLPIARAVKDPETGNRSIEMASEGRDWSSSGGWGPSTSKTTYGLHRDLSRNGYHVKWDDDILPSEADEKEFSKAGFKREGGDYVRTAEGRRGNVVHHRIYPMGGQSGGQYGVETLVNGLPKKVRLPSPKTYRSEKPILGSVHDAILETNRRHRKYGAVDERPQLPTGLHYKDAPGDPWDVHKDDEETTQFWRWHDPELYPSTNQQDRWQIGDNHSHGRSVDWQPMVTVKPQSAFGDEERFDNATHSRENTRVQWGEPICETCYLRHGSSIPNGGHGYAQQRYYDDLDEPKHDFKPMVPDTDQHGNLRESKVAMPLTQDRPIVNKVLRAGTDDEGSEGAQVHDVSLPSGDWVRKLPQYRHLNDAEYRADPADEMYFLGRAGEDANMEEFASRLGHALSDPGDEPITPEVIRGQKASDPSPTAYIRKYPDFTDMENTTGADAHVDTPRGKVLGYFHSVLGDGDKVAHHNMGLVGGKPVSIDHTLSSVGLYADALADKSDPDHMEKMKLHHEFGLSPYEKAHFLSHDRVVNPNAKTPGDLWKVNPRSNPLGQGDTERAVAASETMRPWAQARGVEPWLDAAQKRMHLLGEHASGTESMFPYQMAHEQAPIMHRKGATSPPAQAAYPLMRELILAGKPKFSIRKPGEVDSKHHDMIADSDRPGYHEESDTSPDTPKIYAHRSDTTKATTFLAPLVHNQTKQTGWVRGRTDQDPSEWRMYRDDQIEDAVAGRASRELSPRYKRQRATGRPMTPEQADQILAPQSPEGQWQEGDVPLDEEGHQLVEPRRDFITEPEGRYPWDFDWDKPGSHPLTKRDDEWWKTPA